MDELSPLFHDIEFNERFRGYDVDEVDAYVDRVAKAAAMVQGRIAELQERVVAAEGQVRNGAAGSDDGLSDQDEARLSRVLVLAQRTADAAIEEAEAEAEAMRSDATADAERTRREADDHASLVLAEAETDRRRIIAEAEETAAGAIAAEQARVAGEVAELERHRALVSEDIAVLEQHLAETRLSLSASIAALTELVEAPEAFRALEAPAISGAEMSEPVTEAATEPDAALDEAGPDVEEEPTQAIDAVVVDDNSADLETDAARVDEADETSADPLLDLAPEQLEQPSEPNAEGSIEEAFEAPVLLDAEVAPLPGDDAPAISIDGDSGDDTLDSGEPTLVFDVDLLDPEGIGEPPMADVDEAAPAADVAAAVAPPRLMTAEDVETTSEDGWFDELRQPSAAEPRTDEFLFTPQESSDGDQFIDQLRDAVATGEPEEFGEDALAAFFDGGDDTNERGWFSRRR